MSRKTRAFVWHFFWFILNMALVTIWLLLFKYDEIEGWDYVWGGLAAIGFIGSLNKVDKLI